MTGIAGGAGIAHVIFKDNKNVMYSCEYGSQQLDKSELGQGYNRKSGSEYYRGGELKTDSTLTVRGTMKLAELTGYDILSMPYNVTDDSGKSRSKEYFSVTRSMGDIKLISYSENSVVYSLLYHDGAYISKDDIEDIP